MIQENVGENARDMNKKWLASNSTVVQYYKSNGTYKLEDICSSDDNDNDDEFNV